MHTVIQIQKHFRDLKSFPPLCEWKVKENFIKKFHEKKNNKINREELISATTKVMQELQRSKENEEEKLAQFSFESKNKNKIKKEKKINK